jgi:hypothetical protein
MGLLQEKHLCRLLPEPGIAGSDFAIPGPTHGRCGPGNGSRGRPPPGGFFNCRTFTDKADIDAQLAYWLAHDNALLYYRRSSSRDATISDEETEGEAGRCWRVGESVSFDDSLSILS